MEKLFEFEKILCAITTNVNFGSKSTAITQESPNAQVISSPHAIATNNTTINAIAAVFILFPPLPFQILPRHLQLMIQSSAQILQI